MTCCGFFCSDPLEAKKKPGAFTCYNGQVNDDEPQPPVQTRAKIPWVWSRKFHQSYQMGEKLGEGSFAVVHEGTSLIPPHESFAIKVVNRRNLNRKQLVDFKDEVQILAQIQHQSVVRMYELYKEPEYFFVGKLNPSMFEREESQLIFYVSAVSHELILCLTRCSNGEAFRGRAF